MMKKNNGKATVEQRIDAVGDSRSLSPDLDILNALEGLSGWKTWTEVSPKPQGAQ